MEKWGILYCPKHGIRKPRARRERIEAALRAKGIDYDLVQSENTESVERLVKMFINNGYKTIIVVGGDSALNDAVNCLMQTDSQVREGIVLGTIPNGIMNDFARYWDFRESEPERSVDIVSRRRVRKIDVGCVAYNNKRGEKCRRYFLNCVNVGLIAAMMNLRRQTRHLLGSRTLSHAVSLVLMLFQRLEYRMHLKINSDVVKRKVMTVCVGSARGYGQTPSAVPYNGMLDVSVVYHSELTQFVEGLYLFLRGRFLNHRSVHPYRTRQVVFEDISSAHIGVDGRLVDTPDGAFRITIEQEMINFIIP